jgi:glycosyltransferase involved in cell wall biosynthesis
MPEEQGAPDAAFIVWGPPHKGPRSRVLAQALRIPVIFMTDRWRRGARNVLGYPLLVVRTLGVLGRRRPRTVIVQSPPTIAVWTVAVYAWLRRGAFIIDAHSDAFQRPRWTRPGPLNRFVARRALATIVTNDHWASTIREWGARALVIPDIPVTRGVADGVAGLQPDAFHLLVVNTWADDEPLAAVIDAARQVTDAVFHVTGAADDRVSRLGPIPANVRFTGFLPAAEYFGLMSRVSAVICLTDRDHTMQRGACEALSLARPIVTSDWPLLRKYFDRGTVHVENSSPSIRDAIRRLVRHYDTYVREVRELRQIRVADWENRRRELLDLLESAPER